MRDWDNDVQQKQTENWDHAMHSQDDSGTEDSLSVDERKEDNVPQFTKWRWDGTLAQDGKGLPFIVHVRQFQHKQSKSTMENDTRPAILLNNEIVNLRIAQDVLGLFESHSTEFTSVNVVTALHRIAKFGVEEQMMQDSRFRRLLQWMKFLFPPKKPAELSNMLQFFSRLRLAGDSPLQMIISEPSVLALRLHA